MSLDLSVSTIIQSIVVAALIYMAKLLITATVAVAALQEWTTSHDKHHGGLEKRLDRVEDRVTG